MVEQGKFDPWTVQLIAICYTVYTIPTAVYNIGTEVNLVAQTDIRTLLPKRINNNADHYTRTFVVLFLSGTTTCSMGLPFFRDITLRHWVIVSRHFETACVLTSWVEMSTSMELGHFDPYKSGHYVLSNLFYILVTVHLGTTLINNQLDAQLLIYIYFVRLDVVLIQLTLLMMSIRLLETCRESK
jgi:hypothetical protein